MKTTFHSQALENNFTCLAPLDINIHSSLQIKVCEDLCTFIGSKKINHLLQDVSRKHANDGVWLSPPRWPDASRDADLAACQSRANIWSTRCTWEFDLLRIFSLQHRFLVQIPCPPLFPPPRKKIFFKCLRDSQFSPLMAAVHTCNHVSASVGATETETETCWSCLEKLLQGIIHTCNSSGFLTCAGEGHAQKHSFP